MTAPTADELTRMQLQDIRERADRGERLSNGDRKALWVGRMVAVMDTVDGHLKGKNTANAIQAALQEMALGFIGAASRADALEDRIATLEAAKAKPRHRVPAKSRPA